MASMGYNYLLRHQFSTLERSDRLLEANRYQRFSERLQRRVSGMAATKSAQATFERPDYRNRRTDSRIDYLRASALRASHSGECCIENATENLKSRHY